MSTKNQNQKRSKPGTNCIRDKNGKMLFDSNDVINRWVEHVTELYHDERGDPPDISNQQNGCRVTWGKVPPGAKRPLSNYEFTHASGSIS